MKIAIVYSSNTGNTKIIAEAIKEELSNEDIVYFGKPENNIEADIYIVGSWTDKGNCSSEIKEFLTKLNYKKIAYFGTAGFGGQVEYYQTLFNRVKKNINDTNQILHPCPAALIYLPVFCSEHTSSVEAPLQQNFLFSDLAMPYYYREYPAV